MKRSASPNSDSLGLKNGHLEGHRSKRAGNGPKTPTPSSCWREEDTKEPNMWQVKLRFLENDSSLDISTDFGKETKRATG